MNPRHLRRGPKRLKNLPPGLRRYWQRVRKVSSRRLANPRRSTPRKRRVRRHTSGVTMASRHHLTRHQIRVRAGRKAARTRKRRRHGAVSRRQHHRVFAMNPRHRRSYGRLRFRRNPRRGGGMGSFGSVGGAKRLAIGAGVGALGAVGLDYLWQWGSGYLPVQLQTGYVGTLAKAGAALLGGWAVSKVVGRPTAIAAAGGALTVIGYQLIHQMIAANAPQAAIPATTTAATPAMAGIGAYMQPRMAGLAWTSPGSTLRGLRAYMPGQSMAPVMNRPGGSVSASGLASPGGWG